MDPLSIFGAASTALQIVGALVGYIKDVKNAVRDHEGWIMEMDSIQRHLEKLKERLERVELDKSATWYHHFIEAMGLDDADLTSGIPLREIRPRVDSPFGQLAQKLTILTKKLNIKPGRRHCLLLRGLHHFNKTDVASSFNEIFKIQSTFVQTIQLDHFQLSEATHREVVEVRLTLQNQQAEAEKRKALDQLTRLDFAERQNRIYATCFKDDQSPPSQWFLTSQEFVAWQEGRPWPLYCVGKPGAGKTVLSSTVIRHLEEHCRQQPDSERFAVLYLYLDHKETKIQSYASLIRSILRQLLIGLDPQSLCSRSLAFFKDSSKGVRPSDDDVLHIIQAQLSFSTIERVYLIVDALDEYPEQGRATLLDTLQGLSPKKVSLFLTTRPSDEIKPSYVQCMSCSGYLSIYFHCPICPSFDICQGCKNKDKSCRYRHDLVEPKTVTKEVKAPDSEIGRFVKFTLDYQLGIVNATHGSNWAGNTTIGATRLAKLFPSDPRMAEELKSNIIEQVVRTADGMFLLAKLHLDSLKLQPTLAAIRRALNDLSPEVDEIYSTILARIQDQSRIDRDLAMQAIAWVFFAHRSLSTEELIQAMAVKRSETELNFEEQTHFDIILRVTIGLIVNEGGVRIAHRTAQDYFQKHWQDLFPRGRINIAHDTLDYLSFTALSVTCKGEQEDQQIEARLRKYPFLAYVSTYWGEHVQETIEDGVIQDTVLDFLKKPSPLAATIQAAWYVGSRDQSKAAWDVRAGVNAIHICAWYGLGSCIAELLSQMPNLDINSQDEKLGQTPLMYACIKGHTSTVLTLLDLGADVNLENSKGVTATFMALAHGYPDLVELILLRKGVDLSLDLNTVNRQDTSRTVLMLAASKGYQSLVSLLLGRVGLNVNAKDSRSYTALAIATTRDRLDVVETLLNHVDLNIPNDIGSTPLIIASEGGKAEMVRALLKKGADWRIQNYDGDTVFSKAILHGHTDVVKALLKHGVHHRAGASSKRTLLHVACSSDKANPEMIKLLLEENLSVNALGDHGETPLHNASRVGNVEVVKFLINNGAELALEDSHGRTAFIVAWQNGHSTIAKTFQDHSRSTGLAVDSVPDISHLPLWSMAKLGYKDELEDALRIRKTEVHERDPDTESTALHWAIRSKNLEIARNLVDAGAKTDVVDDHERTPLHIAAYLGYYEATELLLEFKAEPNVRNSWGLTPLAIAQSRELYFLAVKLLEALVERPLEASALIREGSSQDTQATFCAAVQLGMLDVSRLVSEYDVDLEGRNEEGKTVMELAKASGDDEVVDWLRQRIYHPGHNTDPIIGT